MFLSRAWVAARVAFDPSVTTSGVVPVPPANVPIGPPSYSTVGPVAPSPICPVPVPWLRIASRSSGPPNVASSTARELKEMESGSVSVAVGARTRAGEPEANSRAAAAPRPITGDPVGTDPVTVPDTTNSNMPMSGSFVSKRTDPNFNPTAVVSIWRMTTPEPFPAMLAGAETRLNPGGKTKLPRVSDPKAVLNSVNDFWTGLPPATADPKSIGVVRPSMTGEPAESVIRSDPAPVPF